MEWGEEEVWFGRQDLWYPGVWLSSSRFSEFILSKEKPIWVASQHSEKSLDLGARGPTFPDLSSRFGTKEHLLCDHGFFPFLGVALGDF